MSAKGVELLRQKGQQVGYIEFLMWLDAASRSQLGQLTACKWSQDESQPSQERVLDRRKEQLLPRDQRKVHRREQHESTEASSQYRPLNTARAREE